MDLQAVKENRHKRATQKTLYDLIKESDKIISFYIHQSRKDIITPTVFLLATTAPQFVLTPGISPKPKGSSQRFRTACTILNEHNFCLLWQSISAKISRCFYQASAKYRNKIMKPVAVLSLLFARLSETLQLLIRPLVIVLIFIALFMAGRAALLWVYPDDFKLLSGENIIAIFLRGLRFDLSIILWAIAAPLLLMTAPLPWAKKAVWQSALGWFCYVAFIFYGLIIVGDLIYFEHVHRHFGPEIGIAADNFTDTAEFVMGHYFWILFSCIAGSIGLLICWRWMLKRLIRPEAGWLPRALATLIALVLAIGGIRGGFSGDRIDMNDAYRKTTVPGAILVLNGPYTAINFFLKTGTVNVDYFSFPEALAITKKMVVAPAERMVDPEYPLLRSRPGREDYHPNVVLILLEGWSAVSVDVIRQSLGLDSKELTPEFDRLCREGVVFTRFYACGQRTRNGLGAVLTGTPSLPTLPFIGKGLEQLSLSYLGRLAQATGYEGYFFHSESARDEDRYISAASTGFTQVLSRDDVPIEKDRYWDTDLYREANRRLAAARQPFLCFILPSAPHAPYRRPDGPWVKFPADSLRHQYWNTLGFADWALGQFFKTARNADYYANTIFIVVSDHIQRKREDKNETFQLFHIPCLVMAPGLLPGVTERIGSQVDIIPTISHLAGWSVPQASLGRSLFDETADDYRGAQCKFSDSMIRIERTGWVHHNLNQRIEGGAFAAGADLDAIEKRLLAFIQVTTNLCLGNRLGKDQQ